MEAKKLQAVEGNYYCCILYITLTMHQMFNVKDSYAQRKVLFYY